MLPLSEKLLPVSPSPRHQLLEEDDFLFDLGGDAFGVFNLGLHPAVVLGIEVYLALQFGQVYQLLLGLGPDWLHGFEGDLG